MKKRRNKAWRVYENDQWVGNFSTRRSAQEYANKHRHLGGTWTVVPGVSRIGNRR